MTKYAIKFDQPELVIRLTPETKLRVDYPTLIAGSCLLPWSGRQPDSFKIGDYEYEIVAKSDSEIIIPLDICGGITPEIRDMIYDNFRFHRVDKTGCRFEYSVKSASCVLVLKKLPLV